MTKKTTSDSETPNSLGTKGKVVAAVAGVAAATAAGIAVAKKVTNAAATNDYEVKVHDDGWQVSKVGTNRAHSVHDTKSTAVDRARELANNNLPSTLKIYKSDGSVEASHEYQDETEHAG